MGLDDRMPNTKALISGEVLPQLADIHAIRDEIYREFDAATTVERHVAIIELFRTVMDVFETSITDPDKVAAFRNARESDYRLLLVKESMIGEYSSPERLMRIIDREVAAGRTAWDDDMRGKLSQMVAAGIGTETQLTLMEQQKQRRPFRATFGALRRIFKV